jgi:hypothetical protein
MPIFPKLLRLDGVMSSTGPSLKKVTYYDIIIKIDMIGLVAVSGAAIASRKG